MSTSSQPSAFPPVAVSSTLPHQSLRLLELPAELLDVVEAQIKNPNKRRKLWFKSSADVASSSRGARSLVSAEEDKDGGGLGFLHLCTDDKIWAVKQVSTSNSVYVTQTCHQPCEVQKQPEQGPGGGRKDNDDDNGDGDGDGDAPVAAGGGVEEQVDERDLVVAAGSRGGITTKAQVKNVLELIEVEADEREVQRKIHDMVPVYHDAEEDGDDPLDQGQPDYVSMRDVLDNIAAPTRLLRDVMRKSFIFALPQPQPTTMRRRPARHGERVYLPTPALLLRHWKEFLQQCTISGVDLERNDAVLEGKDLRAVLDGLAEAEAEAGGTGEEAGPPPSSLALNVTMAILRRLTDVVVVEDADGPDPNNPCDDDPDLDLKSHSLDSIGSRARRKFNPSLARDVVGRWLLLSHHARRTSSSLSDSSSESKYGTMRVGEFTSEWTQLLPDAWAVECNVASLVSSVEGVNVNVNMARDGEGVEVLRFGAPPRGSHASRAAGASHPSSAAAGAGLARDAPSQNQKKRKWHEKFGAQRSAPAAVRK